MSSFDEELAVDEAPGRAPSAGDRGFVGDGERYFLYRAVAVQARAGLPARDAAERIARLFLDVPGEGKEARRRRAIRQGAVRLAKALQEAEEAGGARLLCEIIEDKGLPLSDEERAAFAVPFDGVASARLPDLLSEAAAFLRDVRRPW